MDLRRLSLYRKGPFTSPGPSTSPLPSSRSDVSSPGSDPRPVSPEPPPFENVPLQDNVVMTTFFLTPPENSCDADRRAKYKLVYDRYIELLADTDFEKVYRTMREKDINERYFRGKLTTDLYSKIKGKRGITNPLPTELECRQYESNIKYLYEILLSKGVTDNLDPREISGAGKRKTKKKNVKKRKTLRKKFYGKMH